MIDVSWIIISTLFLACGFVLQYPFLVFSTTLDQNNLKTYTFPMTNPNPLPDWTIGTVTLNSEHFVVLNNLHSMKLQIYTSLTLA